MVFDIIRNVFWIIVNQVRKLFNCDGQEEEMTTWDSLPWEMQGAVMRQMDIVTRGRFQLVSHHSAEIVRYFGKRTPVHLKIKYSYENQFDVSITCGNGGQLNWMIQLIETSGVIAFIHYETVGETLYSKWSTIWRIEDVAWGLVENILKSSEYHIHTVHLELRWHDHSIKPTVAFKKLSTLHLKNSFSVPDLQAALTHFNEIPENVIVEQFSGYNYNIRPALSSPVIQYAENLEIINLGLFSNVDLLRIENRTFIIRQNSITPVGINRFIKKLLSQNRSTPHLWNRIFMIEGDFANDTRIIRSGLSYVLLPPPSPMSFIFGFFTKIVSCSKVYVIFAEDVVILFDDNKFDDRQPKWKKGLEMYVKRNDQV